MIPSLWISRLSICFFFLFGALCPVLNSIILKGSFPYKNQLTLNFQKPYFQLWTNYLGMCIFYVPAYLYNRFKPAPSSVVSVTYKLDILRKTAVPSICNILAQSLLNKALIYVPTTVWQVFFGFQVLFATLFAVTIRKQQLFLVDWLGLFISVAGMCFSGVAALLRGISSDSNQPISNIFFSFIILIFAHGVQAFQTILEEKLLHDEGINGATLTACEGTWGFYIMSFFVMPISSILPPTAALELYENTLESFQMIIKSWRLFGLVFGYLLTVTLFTYSGILVTEMSTAIHRNMYEMLRPLPVWILSFISYYMTESKEIGEPIDTFTILELCGFGVSILGSLIYNRVLKFPCFTYVEDEKSIRTQEKAYFHHSLSHQDESLLSEKNVNSYTVPIIEPR
ncbi:hypothetical protein TRFO_28620 [Tritrichomonas foetus]|uniref:EamA domain-containing protein n=1 Tax=Tritrichomonas foetus TaxID=1144522 RepID=A0A1J4K2K8_9EUKA|nr:hypothetical protein TRFO_28620 [Tritrichomonas foetus]|eukprot:OHT03966.1 hypothetical protein TRFO_28620 [Tritrichomonas foetus]